MGTHRGGRPRVPIEQRKLEGTLKPSRHGQGHELAEPITSPAALEVPASFKPRAMKRYREAWRELVAPLVSSRVLTEADALALEMMAVAVAEFREAHELVVRDGLFVELVFATDKDGVVVYREGPNPALKLRDKAASEFRAWAARFGLTPSDRASLGIAKVQGLTMGVALEGAIGRSPRARGLDNAIDAV